MRKKELMMIALFTLLIAFMEMTAIPSAFFVNIQFADVEPVYFTLMVNFVLIGLVAFVVLKYLCPDWTLGLRKEGLVSGLKSYGLLGGGVAAIGFIAFYVGLKPFDLQPSLFKVMVEGVVYYIGVAIVEELYILVPTYVILGIYSFYALREI